MGGASKTGGSLGTRHNSPPIDLQTLCRAASPSPVKASKKRWCSAINCHGYVIVEAACKAMLPTRAWEKVGTHIDELFRKAGSLKAVFLDSVGSLPRLNLTDSVIECCTDSKAARNKFRINVHNGLIAASSKVPALALRAEEFDEPERQKVDYGRSYTIKGALETQPLRRKLVCVTYGVVGVTEAFNLWVYRRGGEKPPSLASLSSAPEAQQLSFGVALGNLIAHELRHQLGAGKAGVALDHYISGLGMDEADFTDPEAKFTDKDDIATSVSELGRIQIQYTLYPD